MRKSDVYERWGDRYNFAVAKTEVEQPNLTMNQSVYVITRILVQPEHEAAARALLLELIEPTRREPGCLQYDLWQSSISPPEFLLVEAWQSEPDLDAHLSSAHVQEAYIEGGRYLAAPPETRRYQSLTPT